MKGLVGREWAQRHIFSEKGKMFRARICKEQYLFAELSTYFSSLDSAADDQPPTEKNPSNSEHEH